MIGYAFLSVIAVSLVSLVAVGILALERRLVARITFALLSVAVGTLVGDAFLHLIPEAAEVLPVSDVGGLVLLGILIFFVLEKVLRWRHDHHLNHTGHTHVVGYLNLVSDGLHNLLDGALIGIAYFAAGPIGFATTVAVILHEVPQEISDFGILVHAGFTRARALLFNLFSALLALGGLVLALILSDYVENLAPIALPIVAGGFIYIAIADLVPALHGENTRTQIFTQLILVVLGMGLMFALTILE
jgi:zinc and cadmium transporter